MGPGDWRALWDDEEQKIFYEDLPDLRATVPAVLLPKEEGGRAGGTRTLEGTGTPRLTRRRTVESSKRKIRRRG